MIEARVVEQTKNHAIGVVGDIVVIVAFRGSVEDPLHALVGERAVVTEAKRTAAPVRLLVVLPEASLSKPPSDAVRERIRLVIRRTIHHVAKLAVVVSGEGFGSAIHRAAIGVIASMHRTEPRPRVVADVGEALRHLLREDEPAGDILAFCERLGRAVPSAPPG